MAWTPEDEARYQYLGKSVGFFDVPDPAATEAPDGFLGFAGKTAANILPGALEKIVQPMQAIMGGGREDLNPLQAKIPNFFDVRAPQGVGEHIVAGAGELAEYLPGIMMTEGAAASGLMRLGMGANAAKVAGSGLGFGLPMTPHGGESAAIQGGTAALQTAAMPWGWKGKAAAGILGGAAGYYEGSKGPTGTPQQGAIFGALNLLGPTLIDPAIMHITGANKAASAMGKAAEAGAPAPHQPQGPIPFPVMPDPAHPAIAPLQLAPNGVPTSRPGLPFFEVPDPMGLKLQGAPAPSIGGGLPIAGQPAAPGMRMPTPVPTPEFGMMGAGADFAYGRGTDPFDAFAGLQKPSLFTQNELFPSPAPRVFDPRMRMSEQTAGSAGIYGRQPGLFDAFAGVERAPTFGPESIFSPGEASARAQLTAQRTAVRPPVAPTPAAVLAGKRVKAPHEQIPTGLQKLLGDDVGWTTPGTPLKAGFTRDAFNLGKKLKTQKDIDRATKMADHYAKASRDASNSATDTTGLELASEYASRKQYFTEAVEYATGNPPKAATFRRHDPSYVPNVPHVEWTRMIEAGLDAPVPKVGDQIMHWTEDGFPLETQVLSQDNGTVKYLEKNMITGETAERVASLQEFDKLQKHPQDRPVVEAQTKPIEPPPPPPPPKAKKKPSPAAPPPAPPVAPTETSRFFDDTGNPSKPVEPAAVKPQQVRVQGRFGMETATIIGQEGNTLHIEVDDPIFGPRRTSVLKSDTQPVAGSQVPETPKGGTVPFQDIKSLNLSGKENIKGTLRGGEEGEMLGMGDEVLDFDAEAIARRNIEEDGTFWYSGKLVPATSTNVRLAIKSAGPDLKKKMERLAALQKAKKENPNPQPHEVRQHLEADSHEVDWNEAIRNVEHGIADTKQWMQDLHNANQVFIDRENMGYVPLTREQQSRQRLIAALQKLGPEQHAARVNSMDGPYNPHVLELTNKFGLRESDGRVRTIAEEIAYQQRFLPEETRGSIEGGLLEGSGPAGVHKTLPGRERETLTFAEGLKKLPAEAAAVIGAIYQRVLHAVGHDIDSGLSLKMPGAKGGMYEQSGRVAYNLQWINGIVKNWDKMNEASRGRVLMRITALFGHEVSHVVHIFGEKSGLLIDGQPVTKVIMDKVAAMSQAQRHYISQQIKDAKGDLGGLLSKYLAGDVDEVFKWYSKRRPGLTMEKAQELAAGELMAEIGSIELAKRMKLDGLPDYFRAAVDKFKEVLVRVVNWFKGQKEIEGVAALQSLQDISAKMYDHFAAADTHALGKAYPASSAWKPAPTPNPFSSGTLPPSPSGLPPMVIAHSGLLKMELLRLGVRASVGGALGGIIGPQVGPNQISTAEGIIMGAIAGMFGPAVAKRLLSGQLPQEIKAAVIASKGNPIKTMAHILGGKSLRELGQEGRFGWSGESSALSKFVRWIEAEFNMNLDPKMKALVEEGRGPGSEQLAIMSDALDKVRWYQPSESMYKAVGEYFEGRITKDQFNALLTTPELQTYGNFITTARESMTTLTQMFAAGMPRSKFKAHLIETSDKYLGRFYAAYKEGKFDMTKFAAAKADFMERYGAEGYTDKMADDIMREFMREVQANRSMFAPRRGNSGQKIDTSTTYRRLATEQEIEAQQVIVGGLEHDPYNPEYLKEKGRLDWMETHKITDNWRAWLGEYTNPVQRMIFTFQKVHPSAISGKIFDMLDTRVNSNGLKFSYTSKELQTTRELIQSEIAKGTLPAEEVARLQMQLKELDGYGALPAGSAYGKLQTKWVDRFTRDEMNTYATPFKWMDQPLIRGIAEFNNMIKLNRTALTPLTTIRNYLAMPFMGLISKTTPGDVGEAFKIIHRLKNEDYRLMLRRHIIGADYVSSELSKGPGTIFSGYMDTDVAMKGLKYGMQALLKNYQQPDMLIRAGAFISARKRIAKRAIEEGRFATLQEAMLDPKVIDDAVDFTERYTMNYDTVPRIVKVGRQLPFVNMFISYTSEITRILKNLAEDAISPGANSAGRMHAITVLSGMVALPAMLLAGAKANLSPKDRADWEKIEKASASYNRSRFRIPTGRDKEGRFHYFDITNMLPADNWSQMMRAAINGDAEAALAANPLVSLQNTPLLNMAAEQIAGEDLRTGQKIAGYGRVREILKETLPPVIPPGYEGQRLIRAFSENEQGGMGLTNIKSGTQYRPSDIVANYLTGLRFGNVQLASVQKAAISEAKQEIALQQQLMRETMNVNVPMEVKAKARNIYRQAVEQIMLKLHSKMGIPEPELP